MANAEAEVALPSVPTCGPARPALTANCSTAAVSTLCDGEEHSGGVSRFMDEDIRQT